MCGVWWLAYWHLCRWSVRILHLENIPAWRRRARPKSSRAFLAEGAASLLSSVFIADSRGWEDCCLLTSLPLTHPVWDEFVDVSGWHAISKQHRPPLKLMPPPQQWFSTVYGSTVRISRIERFTSLVESKNQTDVLWHYGNSHML